jgi:hypothetical protein
MCKGKMNVKAELFFNLIVGPEGARQGKDTIAWKSSRMLQAVKRLIFFSEIFPKKYQSEFLNELFPKKGIAVQDDSDDETPEAMLWSDPYLILAEEKFDQIFKDIYEEQIMDHIFEKNESLITLDDFRSALAGDMDEKAKCNWLFSPIQSRPYFNTFKNVF